MAQRRNVGNSYTVGHSSSVFLVDRKGRLRGMMPYGASAGDYIHDIKALLAE
jgi:protein SCO1